MVKSVVTHHNDYKFNLSHWKPQPGEVEPPLELILKTALWSAPAYTDLRDRLQRPAPSVNVTKGGQFVTVNIRSKEVQASEAAPAVAEEVPSSPEDSAPAPKQQV